MNINAKHEVLSHIARRGLLLAALLAIVLSVATFTHAQSNGTSAATLAEKPSATTVTTIQAPNVGAKPAAAPANAPASAEGKPPAKGMQEGIKVHGHWIIEVRNPDGTVDKHVELENEICPPQRYAAVAGVTTQPRSTIFDGGASFFSGLASGQRSAGGWQIILGSSAEINSTSGVPPGCLAPQNVYTPFTAPGIPSDVINILQNNMDTSYIGICQAIQNCSGTLTPPPPPTLSGPNISLSGLFTVPLTESGTIAVVSTANHYCNEFSGLNSPTACLAATATTFDLHGNPIIPAIVTGTQLPGTGVGYSGGQTIAVTVVISFQ